MVQSTYAIPVNESISVSRVPATLVDATINNTTGVRTYEIQDIFAATGIDLTAAASVGFAFKLNAVIFSGAGTSVLPTNGAGTNSSQITSQIEWISTSNTITNPDDNRPVRIRPSAMSGESSWFVIKLAGAVPLLVNSISGIIPGASSSPDGPDTVFGIRASQSARIDYFDISIRYPNDFTLE